MIVKIGKQDSESLWVLDTDQCTNEEMNELLENVKNEVVLSITLTFNDNITIDGANSLFNGSEDPNDIVAVYNIIIQ